MRCIQVVYFLKVVMHFAPLSALCSRVGKFLGLKTKKKRFNRFFLCERNKKSLRFFSDGIDDCYKDTIFLYYTRIK